MRQFWHDSRAIYGLGCISGFVWTPFLADIWISGFLSKRTSRRDVRVYKKSDRKPKKLVYEDLGGFQRGGNGRESM